MAAQCQKLHADGGPEDERDREGRHGGVISQHPFQVNRLQFAVSEDSRVTANWIVRAATATTPRSLQAGICDVRTAADGRVEKIPYFAFFPQGFSGRPGPAVGANRRAARLANTQHGRIVRAPGGTSKQEACRHAGRSVPVRPHTSGRATLAAFALFRQTELHDLGATCATHPRQEPGCHDRHLPQQFSQFAVDFAGIAGCGSPHCRPYRSGSWSGRVRIPIELASGLSSPPGSYNWGQGSGFSAR